MSWTRIVLLTAIVCSLNGCAGCQQQWSHVKSSVAGLNRHITLYSNDGKILKEWDTTSQVEDKGGSFRFMVDGKAIQVSGTVLIEEK